MNPIKAQEEAVRAVLSSDSAALERVLPYVVDIDAMLPNLNSLVDETLIHKAMGSKIECLQQLLGAGANAFKPDSTGVYPLAAASAAGRLDYVELLLAHGAGKAVAKKTFASALWCAACNGQEEVLSALITWAPGPQDDPWAVNGAREALVGTVEGFDRAERFDQTPLCAKVLSCAREIAPYVKDFESENVANSLRMSASIRRLPVFERWIEEEVARREAGKIAAVCPLPADSQDGEERVKKLRL